MRSRLPILVVGAVHLDVYARKREGKKAHFTGDINFSIGGVGFNIAANLVHARYPVNLLSALDHSTIPARAIYSVLKESGIGVRYLVPIEKPEDFGYVAVLSADGTLEAGIT